MPNFDRLSHRRRSSHRRRAATLVVGVLVGAAALSACGSDDDEPTPVAAGADGESATTTTDFGLVPPDVAASLAADESITVIDVRTPQEFDEGHLERAVLIDVNGPSFDAEIAELDPDETYLVYCRSGNRSAQAVAAMAERGIDRVYELEGGVVAYTAAGQTLTG